MAYPTEGPGHGVSAPVAFRLDAIYSQSETARYPLGAVMRSWDRTWHYCQASETLTAGDAVSGLPYSFTEAPVTVAHAIGTRTVTVTNGNAATIYANDLAGGELTVYEGTGAGDSYIIKSNTAAVTTATMSITLATGLVTAWVVANTDLSVCGPIWRVQQGNTTGIEKPVGTTRIDVTDEYYFWAQTYGLAPACWDVTEGALIDEVGLTLGTGTAGQVEKINTIGNSIIGENPMSAQDGTADDYSPIFLTVAL